MLRPTGPGDRRGMTVIELLVAATVGLLLAGSAVGLCVVGTRAVAALGRSQRGWQEVRAAAGLWADDVREAGYDPLGTAGGGFVRALPDTLELTADRNANGALVPTASNPVERLAYAVAPGAWVRGVNGGPRLPLAPVGGLEFGYRDPTGADLGPVPDRARIAIVEARAAVPAGRSPTAVPARYAAARRNPPP